MKHSTKTETAALIAGINRHQMRRKAARFVALIAFIASGGTLSTYADTFETDLAISDIKIERINYAVGEQPSVSFTISNGGTNTVNSFVLEYTVNGEAVKTQTYEKTLIAGRETSISEDMPLGIKSQHIGIRIGVNIKEVDGQADTNVANNNAEESINVYNTLFDRNVVIEEGTGTWCGFCVGGIVAMENMRKTHPTDFIGIAVHNNDKMTVKEYTERMGISNYPGCNLNRDSKQLGVSAAAFETYYQFGKMQKALGAIYIDGVEALENGKVKLTATSEFAYSGDDSYNVAFVLIEDRVTGYKQSNKYAGGEYGEMGGFEDLPAIVDIEHMDVARGIYPSYDGAILTTTEKEGEEYTYSYTIEIPAEVQHKSNLSVAALLIDAKTGIIVNAAKTSLNLKDDTNHDQPGGDNKDYPVGEYKFVDLGLSVLWSWSNMMGAEQDFTQASKEEECGGYFGWADPTGLLTEANDALYPSGEVPVNISGTDLDIATMKWKNSWRLPTHEEFEELYNNCKVTSETLNGVAGSRFTSIINNNSIFLPYNGNRYETEIWDVGNYGSYWSGTLYNEEMEGVYYAYELDFDDYGVNINNVALRHEGMGVRPVCAKTSVGASGIADSTVLESVKYYTVDGTPVDSEATGLLIRQEIFSDGTIVTKKILRN